MGIDHKKFAKDPVVLFLLISYRNVMPAPAGIHSIIRTSGYSLARV